MTPTWSKQYASIIFYHSEEQQSQAIKSMQQEEARLGRKTSTEIMPFSKFFLAEDYHQKYYLRHHKELLKELASLYPDSAGFVNSTAAARLNGYMGGYGTLAALKAEMEGYGLSSEGKKGLLRLVEAGDLSAYCSHGR